MPKPIFIFLLSYFLIGLFIKVNGQLTEIVITITDSLNKPVKNTNIRISNPQNRLLIAYGSLGDTNRYQKKLQLSGIDTLNIQVSHIAYQTKNQKIALADFAGTKVEIPVTLLPPDPTLPNAMVTAPPTWRRGDTTFYRADAFKQEGDRKLIDLVARLPDFHIDEQGRLKFKNKSIEKITIEGEEIFTDKEQLLLSSFPVHVLDQLQALENQSRESILKGLADDNLVTLNLKLKKDKLKAAFGDGEVGVSTNGRYHFNPVLFALYGKVKLGLIANYNTLGTGFDWRYEAELMKDFPPQADEWLLRGNQLQLINNFESKRYITNRLFDNRLQINIPISKQWNTKTEINYINDWQRQSIFKEQSLLTDTGYTQRNDRTDLQKKPRFLLINHLHEWRPTDKTKWTAALSLGQNMTESALDAQYLFANQNPLLNNQQIKNRWNNYAFITEYIKRVSLTTALKWSLQTNYQQLSQNGAGQSMDYPFIFGLSPGFDQQIQNLNLYRHQVLTKLSGYRKARKILYHHGIEIDYENFRFDNQFGFQKTGQTDSYQKDERFSNANQDLLSLKMLAHTAFSTSMGNWPLSITAKGGAHIIRLPQTTQQQNRLLPHLETSLRSNKFFANKSTLTFQAGHQSTAFLPYQYHNMLYPRNMQEFTRFTGNRNANHVSNIMASYGMRIKKLIGGFTVMYNRYWQGNVYQPQLLQFVQIGVDSITGTSNNSLTASINSAYINILRNFHWNTTLGFYRVERQLIQKKQTVKGNISNVYLNNRVTKKWENQFLIEWVTQVSLAQFNVPTSGGSQPINKTGNFFTQLKAGFKIKPWFNLQFTPEYFIQNMGTPQKLNLLMLDAEAVFSIPKKPFSFRLNFENLTNQRNYSLILNDEIRSQSVLNMPLIGRNLVFNFRYEL